MAAPRRPGWARKRVLLPTVIVLLAAGAAVAVLPRDGRGDDGADGDVRSTHPRAVALGGGGHAQQRPDPAGRHGRGDREAGEADGKAPASTAVLKVWGASSSGVDIMYGRDGVTSDADTLPLTKALEIQKGALYYQVTARLRGVGDIQCSVTIQARTVTGRAQGDGTTCAVQMNRALFGDEFK